MDAASLAIPGAARDAYAAAAEGANGGERRSLKPSKQPQVPSERPEFPGGEAPLPEHPADFVEELHRQVSLFEVWKSLLRAEDEKIRQRAAEKLTEMRYKGAAAMEDERPQILIDIDSAVARRAARSQSGEGND